MVQVRDRAYERQLRPTSSQRGNLIFDKPRAVINHEYQKGPQKPHPQRRVTGIAGDQSIRGRQGRAVGLPIVFLISFDGVRNWVWRGSASSSRRLGAPYRNRREICLVNCVDVAIAEVSNYTTKAGLADDVVRRQGSTLGAPCSLTMSALVG